MCISNERKQCILECIKENNGEKKLADEWVQLINTKLPSNKTLPTRAATHVLHIMSRMNYFKLVKDQHRTTVYYQFIL